MNEESCLHCAAYVIMLAGANEISSGAVGLTYLCAVLPSLLVKATGPYWFHYLSYKVRSWLIAALMSLSYVVVAFGDGLAPQVKSLLRHSVKSKHDMSSGQAMLSCLRRRSCLASFWGPCKAAWARRRAWLCAHSMIAAESSHSGAPALALQVGYLLQAKLRSCSRQHQVAD